MVVCQEALDECLLGQVDRNITGSRIDVPLVIGAEKPFNRIHKVNANMGLTSSDWEK